MNTINMKEHLYCLGCLCHDSERNLVSFKFQNVTFKAMFQENIYLCFVCKKIAQNMEKFVQNVHNNQLLMENSQKISDSTINAPTNHFHPIVNLSEVTLIPIETNDARYIDEPVFVIYSSRLKVKQELKPELSADQDYELFCDNDFQDSAIKADDDLRNETKDEDHLENLNLKLLSKQLKKNKALEENCFLSKKKMKNYNDKIKRKYQDFQDSAIKADDDLRNETKDEDEDHLENFNLKLLSKKLNKNKAREDNCFLSKKKKKNYNDKIKRKYQDFQNRTIKEDGHICNETKDEDNLVNVNSKLLSKKLKKSRAVDNIKTNIYNDMKQRKNKDCIVTVTHITKKQCDQERENMLKDPKYTNRVYRCENRIKGFTFKEIRETYGKTQQGDG